MHIYGEPGAQRKVHAGFGKGHPETTWRKLGRRRVPISLNGLAALLGGHPLRATRPLHFFRPGGPMPEAVTLNFAFPRELGDVGQLRAELRERVAAVELAVAAYAPEQRLQRGPAIPPDLAEEQVERLDVRRPLMRAARSATVWSAGPARSARPAPAAAAALCAACH